MLLCTVPYRYTVVLWEDDSIPVQYCLILITSKSIIEDNSSRDNIEIGKNRACVCVHKKKIHPPTKHKEMRHETETNIPTLILEKQDADHHQHTTTPTPTPPDTQTTEQYK